MHVQTSEHAMMRHLGLVNSDARIRGFVKGRSGQLLPFVALQALVLASTMQ